VTRLCTLQSVCHSITSGEQHPLGQQRSVITACCAAVLATGSAPSLGAAVVADVARCRHLACLLHSAGLISGMQLHLRCVN
jgi:hypothetical protein